VESCGVWVSCGDVKTGEKTIIASHRYRDTRARDRGPDARARAARPRGPLRRSAVGSARVGFRRDGRGTTRHGMCAVLIYSCRAIRMEIGQASRRSREVPEGSDQDQTLEHTTCVRDGDAAPSSTACGYPRLTRVSRLPMLLTVDERREERSCEMLIGAPKEESRRAPRPWPLLQTSLLCAPASRSACGGVHGAGHSQGTCHPGAPASVARRRGRALGGGGGSSEAIIVVAGRLLEVLEAQPIGVHPIA
jgi:hypothetical protein